MKPFAWSYSRLSAFENCPRKFWYDQNFKPPPGEENSYGLDVHKHFENYSKQGTTLPMDLQHHAQHIDKVLAQATPLTEQKMCLNSDFQPTGWFDNDAWCRGILDFAGTKAESERVLIVDWKTGKRRPVWEQLYLQAAMLRCYDLGFTPKEFLIGFYWTKDKEFDWQVFTPAQIPKLWDNLLPRVERFAEAWNSGQYPEKQNFLCKRYCNDKQCKYNGI